MPKVPTRSAVSLIAPIVHIAGGLHDPARGRTYFFNHFDSQLLIIGRSKYAEIRVKDPHVSHGHATIKLRCDGRPVIRDTSRNGTYVDGLRITGGTVLIPGMQVYLGGNAILVATDRNGAFPIRAHTISEMCYLAVELYGSPNIAATHLGKSRTFVSKGHDMYQERFRETLYGSKPRVELLRNLRTCVER